MSGGCAVLVPLAGLAAEGGRLGRRLGSRAINSWFVAGAGTSGRSLYCDLHNQHHWRLAQPAT